MQTSGARNTDPSRKNAHQYRPLTQALRDRGCRRDASERGGKRVDAQFTGDPKQPHGDKSEYRPLTQGRERVGASPQEYRPLAHGSHRAENVGCGSVERWPRDPSEGAAAKEYRPLTQESALRASKIQTFRAKDADLSRKVLPTAGARDYRLPEQERRRIPTSRTSNTDLSRKATLGNSCKSMHLIDRLPFPCCSCMCLMFCCSKRWEDEGWEGKAPSRFAFGRHHSPS